MRVSGNGTYPILRAFEIPYLSRLMLAILSILKSVLMRQKSEVISQVKLREACLLVPGC